MLIVAILVAPLSVSAEDAIEKAGVGVGVSAGNAVLLPIKAVSVLVGLTVGAVSFIFSGGNAELTKQIWNDVTEGPYVITPEVARTGIGERPELPKK
jgi:P pilus assembly chaperone PapD